MVSLRETGDREKREAGYNFIFVLSTLFSARINLQITGLNLLNYFLKSLFPKGKDNRKGAQ